MDWNLPTLSSLYSDFLTYLKGRDTDLAKGLDPLKVTVTNPVTDMICWRSANARWEIYNGATWVPLIGQYAIDVTSLGGSLANLYAKLAGPTFTGVPNAPTAAVDTNTVQIATTQFVINQGYAKLSAPTFSGAPSVSGAPPAVGTSTTQIATTAFVAAGLALKQNSLGFTPYNATNPSGFISGITSGMVTGALGYTPPQPTGIGASGTWGINISGNAATATSAPNSVPKDCGSLGIGMFALGLPSTPGAFCNPGDTTGSFYQRFWSDVTLSGAVVAGTWRNVGGTGAGDFSGVLYSGWFQRIA